MPGEIVVDASVAAKIYFDEDDSDAARSALGAGDVLIAPSLLLLEIASIASTRVRRKLSSRDQGHLATQSVASLLDQIAPIDSLAVRAFELSCDYGFSAYDAAYLALAESRRCQLLTADQKLARRAADAGLGHLVRPL